MNLIGKLLDNRYEILEKVGNGGMAMVYKAKDQLLNRYVAVKILRDEFTTDSEFIKRFRTEAQSAAGLAHPNIVQIYDVGSEDNLYYIVMELLQGKTLKEIIDEDGSLSWKWSVNIAMQIASALETAHKNGIIHRDIKPHNIVITEDGIAKVTDFGIAKAVSNSTITAFGTTIGSVHYFSPEHARGGYTDAKSDLYSLGVVMYEMLTGRVPFDADTPVSVALKQVQEEPVEPIKINDTIPLSVNRIVLKAMQKDPNTRYQDATEMLKDLKLALKRPNEDFVELVTRDDSSPTQKVPTILEIEMEKNNDRKAPKIGESETFEDTAFAKFRSFLKEHKVIKVLLVLLCLLLLFLVALFGTIGILKAKRPAQAQIPNLVYSSTDKTKRLTQEQAEQLLQAAGFKNVKIIEAYDDKVEKGQVISQSPEFKESFNYNLGEEITITVSKGQKKITLPEKMVGEKYETVEKKLKDIEATYEKQEVNDEEVEVGLVVEVTPGEGEEIPASTKVIVKVSKGSSYKDIDIPSVINQTEDAARSILQEAGFTGTIEIKTEENTSKSDGIVLRQSIEPGSKVKENEKITLTINKLPDEHTVTISVTIPKYKTKKDTSNSTNTTEVPDPKTHSIQIYVDDDRIFNDSVTEEATEKTITKTWDSSNRVTVKLIADGDTYPSKTADLSAGNQEVSFTVNQK